MKSASPPNPRRAAAGHWNGLLAKGRKSAAGRARSAQNAIKHHFCSRNFYLLPTEDPEQFAEVSAALENTYAPQDPVEHGFVSEIIGEEWKLARLEAMEAAALTLEIEKITKKATPVPLSEHICDADLVLWLAFQNLQANPSYPLLFRYRAQYERSRNRAIKNLESYRAMPKLQPVDLDAEPDAQPDTQPDAPTETIPTPVASSPDGPIPFPQPPPDPKPKFDKTKVTDPYPLL